MAGFPPLYVTMNLHEANRPQLRAVLHIAWGTQSFYPRIDLILDKSNGETCRNLQRCTYFWLDSPTWAWTPGMRPSQRHSKVTSLLQFSEKYVPKNQKSSGRMIVFRTNTRGKSSQIEGLRQGRGPKRPGECPPSWSWVWQPAPDEIL